MIAHCISPLHTDPTELFRAYEQASLAARKGNVQEHFSLCHYEAGGAQVTPLYAQEKENQLFYLLENGRSDAMENMFDELISSFSTRDVSVYSLQRNFWILFGSIEKKLNQLGESRERLAEVNLIEQQITNCFHIDEIKSLFLPFLHQVSRSLQQKKIEMHDTQDGKFVMRHILKTIEDQYDQTLSLHDFARYFHIHADYLSRLFKKSTGKTAGQ